MSEYDCRNNPRRQPHRDELPYSQKSGHDLISESEENHRTTRSCLWSGNSKVIPIGAEDARKNGTAASIELESFLQTKVFLSHAVKVKNWRDDESRLQALRFRGGS